MTEVNQNSFFNSPISFYVKINICILEHWLIKKLTMELNGNNFYFEFNNMPK